MPEEALRRSKPRKSALRQNPVPRPVQKSSRPPREKATRRVDSDKQIMNRLRTLLEEIKRLDDQHREVKNRPPNSAMTLFPPAAPDAVKKLIGGGWTHDLPASFGEFLAASDGVAKFRGQ